MAADFNIATATPVDSVPAGALLLFYSGGWDCVPVEDLGYATTIHSHEISSVNGLQAALDGKASTSHSHAISNVTGLQTALDGKASTSHSHAIADVTGLQAALDGKASTSHSHAISNVTGLQTALDGKQAAGSYAPYAAMASKLDSQTYESVNPTGETVIGRIAVPEFGTGETIGYIAVYAVPDSPPPPPPPPSTPTIMATATGATEITVVVTDHTGATYVTVNLNANASGSAGSFITEGTADEGNGWTVVFSSPDVEESSSYYIDAYADGEYGPSGFQIVYT